MQERLASFKFEERSNPTKLNALVKGLIDGELCSMICHLVKVEAKLGRSTVIDLSAKTENKFR